MTWLALGVAGLGAAAFVSGHLLPHVALFYLGTLLLIVALGPLAFAAGRDRWPDGLLLASAVVALVLLLLVGVEAIWAGFERVRGGRGGEAPPMVATYAGAERDPAGFRRWWRYASEAQRPRRLVHDDPQGLNPYVLEPNTETRVHESLIRVNSLGFRGREVEREKGGKYRILALGESTTFGYTLRADDAPWPEVLERLISAELDCDAPVEVVNAGVPGWTLANQLRRLDSDILPLEPDLVISYHGYNGFGFFFDALPSMLVREGPGQASRPSRLLTAAENLLSRRRFLARYEKARDLARGVPEIDLDASLYAKLYRRLARRLAARGIPVVVATFDMAVDDDSPEEVVRFYEQTFPDIRARILANRMHTRLVLGIPLGKNVIPVDTREGLDGAYQDAYIDAFHFTQPGRERLARHLLDGIRDELARSPRLRCRG